MRLRPAPLRPAFAAAALLLACVLGGCRELADLVGLSIKLSREFGGEVSLTVNNGTSLAIVFDNVAWAKLPEPTREQRAREAARFALENYSRGDRLVMVSVAFRDRQTAGPVSVTASGAPYAWSAAELRGAGIPAEALLPAAEAVPPAGE